MEYSDKEYKPLIVKYEKYKHSSTILVFTENETEKTHNLINAITGTKADTIFQMLIGNISIKEGQAIYFDLNSKK